MTADPRNLIRFVPAKGVQTRDLRPITTGGFVVLMHVEQVVIVADGRSDQFFAEIESENRPR